MAGYNPVQSRYGWGDFFSDVGDFAKGAAPYVLGAAQIGGDIYSAQQTREEAQKNRDFQERMSNTAVQRSVEDYRKAGLNPALAYDRSASSPGGAQAQIGNPIAGGISTIQSARAQKQAMALARQQMQLNAEVARTQAVANMGSAHRDESQANNNLAQERLSNQLFTFNSLYQPAQIRAQQLANQLNALGLPKAQNMSDLERAAGLIIGPGLNSASKIRDYISNIFGDKGIK